MATIRSRIATSQKELDEEVKRLDEETQKEKDLLDIQCEEQKEKFCDALVEGIVGKFI